MDPTYPLAMKTMRLWICNAILLVLVLCGTSLKAQDDVLDSLRHELKLHSQEDTQHVNILYKLAFHQYPTDKNKARQFAESALDIAGRLSYEKGISNANFALATWYYDHNDSERSMQHALQALKYAELANWGKGKASSALLVGRNYMRALHDDKAILYFRRSLAENLRMRDESRAATDYSYLGLMFDRQGKYDSALKYYNMHLKVREVERDTSSMILGYNNVGAMNTFLGRYEVAKEYLFKALALAENRKTNDRLALVRQSVGEWYARQGSYDNAKKYLEAALQVAREIRHYPRQEQIYLRLKDLEAAQGNFEKAYDHQSRLLAIKDSLYNSERFQKVAALETYYQTQEKESAIRTLEQAQADERLWRYVLIAGIALMSIAAATIFYLQRSRAQKTKQLLNVQQHLNEKLTEVDKLKSRFFANISHEFRTPLTLVLAPLDEQLKKAALADDERTRLQMVKRNANRLLDLVNQLLDLSKLEAGKMELHVRKGKLNLFLSAIASSFDSWAELKDVRFTKSLELREDYYCFDQDKVEKIVTNLLANAFKFTPAGGAVTFSAKVSSEGIDQTLAITVTDTGKGIPEEEQQHVFLPFYQTKQRTEAHHGGTGLGLSLVKELVKLYNGEIHLSSRAGVGTSLRVTLPVSAEAFELRDVEVVADESYLINGIATTGKDKFVYQETDVESNSDGKDTIIIAEDNADLRTFMVSVLQDYFSIVVAPDGEEAYKLAVQIIPNLVLTDLMMPRLDGLQLTERLRQDERTSHIPVVVLTAKNESQSRIEGLRSGADDYLTKPFSTEELLVRVQNLIEQRKKLAIRFQERILITTTPLKELSLDDRFLNKVREIVESNLSDPLFTVERMAEEANLSRTQLLRKLKALTGISPNEFIRDLRLKRAAEMIEQRVDTITQIGYAVGFNDQSYFSKCFKKHFGVAPTEYANAVTTKN